jgi:hypothetical protein
MVESPYIQFIEVITANKVYRKYLKTGEEPWLNSTQRTAYQRSGILQSARTVG